MIGDTIRFVSKRNSEFVVTGRIKHFLSITGEHLSVGNMNDGIKEISDELGISVREFTVAGKTYESLFAHHWYIGTDDTVDPAIFKQKLDNALCRLNDDYRTARKSTLPEIFVKVIPSSIFYDWMRANGKEGGMNKFPRVLTGDKLADWENYLAINCGQPAVSDLDN